MARHVELADVADGISGHELWSIEVEGFPFEEKLGREYRLDLLAPAAHPSSRYLHAKAVAVQSELDRHLTARKIPREWLSAAVLEVSLGADGPHETLVTCRVELTDDRGRTHTSTRRAGVRRPLRTHRTGTARFNWIVLLVSGLLMFGIGATGVAAGAADRTTVWFVMGLGLLIGAVVLRRMRLP
jgi:hypothetical protein